MYEREHFFRLSVVFLINLAALTACSGNSDSDDTLLSPVSETEKTVKSTEEKTEDTLKGTEVERTEDDDESESLRSWSTCKEEVAERVLLSLKNQCLEWYYADYHLDTRWTMAEDPDKMPDYKPGTTLYYQVWCNERGTAYRINWSDDKSFNNYDMDTFEYLVVADQIKKWNVQAYINQMVVEGEFVIPDRIEKRDPLPYVYIDEEIEKKWKEWFTGELSSVWNSSFTKAYLMPYYVEEDGSADFCVYLEDENGFYLMVRGEAKADGSESEKKPIIQWNTSLNGEYGVIGWKWLAEDTRSFKEQYFPNAKDYGVFRHVYYPENGLYRSICYEAVYGDRVLKISDGNDFIRSIQDLAERTLPVDVSE